MSEKKKTILELTPELEKLVQELGTSLGLSKSDIIRVGIVLASKHFQIKDE